MKKIALFGILACSALFADSEPTRDWIAELRAGAFLPNSHTIKKMFGRGWIEGEAEFTYRFAGHFAVWGNAGYSYKNGHSNFHHNAHIWIIPVSAGLKYLFRLDRMRPYLGFGPSYTFLHLKNYSPLTSQRVYKNRFGYVAKSGIYIDLSRRWALDLFLDYYSLKVHFQKAKKADISGIRTGIGLGYKF